MEIKTLKIGDDELINVPADEKTLADLGVASADIPSILAEAKQAQLAAQCVHARSFAYQCESDGLAFDYLAAMAEFGEASEAAQAAKTAWLQARSTIKNRYPKPQ
ncbi:hypothetical protein [Pseudoalteromonas piscicida]|uniref:Uncharacterized protein n=1 Tax=Pseudoalteromonas piscicida TaxID=43662 RepID=A0AAD0RFI4_PSEO7|nr:hypothetical protein [Pseudoalteromonas piscicida]ASD67661.1 hypothetical protein B1L02_11975 [Pseudoalteromonas piscicida]AXR01635.1 hypothetical protein D0511_05760 [Pseudoalteromonas piscicida]